jgi:hypothetical protein
MSWLALFPVREIINPNRAESKHISRSGMFCSDTRLSVRNFPNGNAAMPLAETLPLQPLQPLLTPQGHLRLIADGEAPPLAAEPQERLARSFAEGAGHGLLRLGAAEQCDWLRAMVDGTQKRTRPLFDLTGMRTIRRLPRLGWPV